MDAETTEMNEGRQEQKTQNGQRSRSKTSLRRRYEAEVDVIRSQIGGLEKVRDRLGLSQRKMCQLLMVDPSAWSRWTKDESKVPPHIYRALQWYLALTQEKPEWHPQNSFSPLMHGNVQKDKGMQILQSEIRSQLSQIRSYSNDFADEFRSLTEKWADEKKQLQQRIEKKDTALAVWKLFVLLNTTAVAFWLLWQVLP